MSKICTCKNTKCPLHPINHDKGCTPCISKNLKLGEIPNCFFNLVIEDSEKIQDATLSGFANIVLSKMNQENNE